MFSSLIPSLIVFGVAALAIISAGSQLARLADELADRTGMGEALFGVLLLAGVTSLPDFAATLSAAMDARPDLAMTRSNLRGACHHCNNQRKNTPIDQLERAHQRPAALSIFD